MYSCQKTNGKKFKREMFHLYCHLLVELHLSRFAEFTSLVYVLLASFTSLCFSPLYCTKLGWYVLINQTPKLKKNNKKNNKFYLLETFFLFIGQIFPVSQGYCQRHFLCKGLSTSLNKQCLQKYNCMSELQEQTN